MIHAIGTLTNSNISNLRYSTSIYKNNLEYGVVAMATLQITATSPLTVSDGTTHLPAYTYIVDDVQEGVFYCRRCVKTGDSYSITLYDAACWLSTDDRQTYSNDTTCYHYYNAAGQLTTGTYSTSNPTTISDNEYFTADIGMDDSAGYNAISVHMPAKHDLTFGDKFKIGDDISYVQSISWDISTYTIAGQTDDADNTQTIDSKFVRQGQLITELSVESGRIAATVQRKTGVYRQNTVPRDTDPYPVPSPLPDPDTTKYDLLSTGDLWFVDSDTDVTEGGVTYTHNKWYVCTATGAHSTNNRLVVWGVAPDKIQYTDNIAQLVVSEGQISSRVETVETTIGDANSGLIKQVNTNTSNISQTDSKISTAVSASETTVKAYADGKAATAENNAKNYTTTTLRDYSTTEQTATNISNAVLVETERATAAEDGKLDTTSSTSGFSWHLTSSDWTVNKISSGTTTPIFKVNSSGATVKGKIQADEGYIGKLSLSSGWLTATEDTSQGIILQKGTNTGASNFEVTNLRTNGLSYQYGPASSPTATTTISSAGVSTNAVVTSSLSVNGNISSTGSINAVTRVKANTLACASYGSADPSGGEIGDLYFKI